MIEEKARRMLARMNEAERKIRYEVFAAMNEAWRKIAERDAKRVDRAASFAYAWREAAGIAMLSPLIDVAKFHGPHEQMVALFTQCAEQTPDMMAMLVGKNNTANQRQPT